MPPKKRGRKPKKTKTTAESEPKKVHKKRGRKPKGGKRRVTSESNWKRYYGSCPELKDDIKLYGKESFSREILSVHGTPGRVNYEETRQLFLHDVLTKALTDGAPAFYNSNILGRYYRKDYFDYDSTKTTETN